MSQYNPPLDNKGRKNKQAGEFDSLVVAHAAAYGGMITNFGRDFAKYLIDEGAEVHFFASIMTIYGFSPPIDELEIIGGQFHGLPLPNRLAPFQLIWSLILMTITLRRLRVQVLHTRGSIMGFIGRIAGKLAKVPIIIHHQDDLYSRNKALSPYIKWLVALLEKQLAFLANKSLFITEAILNDALSIGFPKDRCVLVGIDLHEVFRDAICKHIETKEPILSRLRYLGVPKDALIVGCVGRLTYLKGVDLFLEAARRLAPSFQGWVFVIKGDGPLRNLLHDSIQRYQLSKQVFLFTDDLHLNELPILYRCFDLFTLPTRKEGFGMVFVEAMAMSVPVIAPRIQPVTEVVREDCGVLIEPDNLEALVQSLSQLMSDEKMRHILAEKAKEYILTSYCNQKSSERIIGVYRDLLSHSTNIHKSTSVSND